MTRRSSQRIDILSWWGWEFGADGMDDWWGRENWSPDACWCLIRHNMIWHVLSRLEPVTQITCEYKAPATYIDISSAPWHTQTRVHIQTDIISSREGIANPVVVCWNTKPVHRYRINIRASECLKSRGFVCVCFSLLHVGIARRMPACFP